MTPVDPKEPKEPKEKDPKAPDPQPDPQADTAAPTTDAFSQAPPAGGAETGGFNPAMFGDLIGGPSVQTIIRSPSGATISATVPLIGRGAFKIAENESPRPTDRVFFFYNYYDRVNTSTAFSQNPPFNLHREVIGFEKTFFSGNASIGMRLPFLQLTGDTGGIDDNQIGDLSIVFKWAFLNNRDTGSVMSAGMVLTVPSGDPFLSPITGNAIHSTVFQPYFGYILARSNFYAHGFSSLIVPTERDDVVVWLNDLGFGYQFMTNDPDAFIRGIVPTLEAHLVTPLSHRATLDRFHVSDYLTLTAGANLVFGRASTLGVALGVPVTGPRPYNLEGIATLNIRF